MEARSGEVKPSQSVSVRWPLVELPRRGSTASTQNDSSGVGRGDGGTVGSDVGITVGSGVGIEVGDDDGAAVGTGLGADVIEIWNVELLPEKEPSTHFTFTK